MSVKPSVAMNAVRAPRPSSSALVATVMPWENPRPSPTSRAGVLEHRAHGGQHALDWSSGVVGALAVISRPSTASTASVNVPPTSTPRSIAAPYRVGARRNPRAPRQRAQLSDPARLTRRAAGDLLGLGQMLMGRAVAVVGQRHPLARGALTGAGATLQRVAVQVEAVAAAAREELVGAASGTLDDAQDARLRAHREVRADVGEQRPRRPREVMPIGRQPLHGGFARPQHTLMVGVRATACGSSMISFASSR